MDTSIDSIEVAVYQIPCDRKESDGTLVWESTTMVVVSLFSGALQGLGYTYSDASAAQIIAEHFFPLLQGKSTLDIPKIWMEMVRAVRNIGLPGVAASAISAVDVALWDLKARVCELPLYQLFGMAQEKMPVYGSGGFTSYTIDELEEEFRSWQRQGITKFKMKVGRYPDEDLRRVQFARKLIGSESELFVDANGGYSVKQALEFAEKFHREGVVWFEEPVSSDDLEGLHFLSEHAPAGMNITAGEYGYDPFYFRRMLEAKAVDILQADATRCLGYTGFLNTASQCYAHNIHLSSHTTPSLHLPVCLHLPQVCHMEYFHDHVRIEQQFFEGFPRLENGCLLPHEDRLGHGLELRKDQIKPFLVMKKHA